MSFLQVSCIMSSIFVDNSVFMLVISQAPSATGGCGYRGNASVRDRSLVCWLTQDLVAMRQTFNFMSFETPLRRELAVSQASLGLTIKNHQ